MSALDIAKTKFDPAQFDQVPIEKLPSKVSTWIDSVISYLRENSDFDESIQAFIITELNAFLSFVEKSKDIPAILSKPIRLQVSYVYKLAYSGPHRRFLFETVNKLIKIVSSSKADKFSEFKHMAIAVVGSIYDVAGDGALSVAPLCVITLLKALKGSSSVSIH